LKCRSGTDLLQTSLEKPVPYNNCICLNNVDLPGYYTKRWKLKTTNETAHSAIQKTNHSHQRPKTTIW
jgi:hypothetical protein